MSQPERWYVEVLSGDDIEIRDDANITLATFLRIEDAILAAAAPRMLEACRSVLDFFTKPGCDPSDNPIDLLRDVIEQATGGAA